MMRATMMTAMIRATYYAIIQFYFVVYAHNANFILEFYSRPIVQYYLHFLQPIAICHYMVHKQDMVRRTDNGRTAGLRIFQYPNVLGWHKSKLIGQNFRMCHSHAACRASADPPCHGSQRVPN